MRMCSCDNGCFVSSTFALSVSCRTLVCSMHELDNQNSKPSTPEACLLLQYILYAVKHAKPQRQLASPIAVSSNTNIHIHHLFSHLTHKFPNTTLNTPQNNLFRNILRREAQNANPPRTTPPWHNNRHLLRSLTTPLSTRNDIYHLRLRRCRS